MIETFEINKRNIFEYLIIGTFEINKKNIFGNLVIRSSKRNIRNDDIKIQILYNCAEITQNTIILCICHVYICAEYNIICKNVLYIARTFRYLTQTIPLRGEIIFHICVRFGTCLLIMYPISAGKMDLQFGTIRFEKDSEKRLKKRKIEFL